MDTLVYSFQVFKTFFLIDLTLKSSNLGKDIIVSLSKGLKSQWKINMQVLNSTM